MKNKILSLRNKILSLRNGILISSVGGAVLVPAVAFADSNENVNIAVYQTMGNKLVDAFNTTVVGMLDVIGNVLPVALTIFGVTLLIAYCIKLFRLITKK